jgi:hypothetical protein
MNEGVAAMNRSFCRLLPRVIRFALMVILASGASAQTFNSGSNGSDGALNLTTPGTIVFDPKVLNLDLDGDRVFHFTTINIGPGVIVRLSGKVINGPVYWLAQGAVTISGTLNLNGDDGYPQNSVPADRAPSTPGAGGYSGGAGAFGASPAQPGFGPGGGFVVVGGGCNGFPVGGTFTGNAYLVPLVGGSGGAGNNIGAGGGAGGGAILIASSTSIAVNGVISASGGNFGACPSCLGASGSRGGIRLAAPSIVGTGQISAPGGAGSSGCNSLTNGGGIGKVRLEAFQNSFSGSITADIARATPFNTFVPAVAQNVRVVSVAGVAVPPSPTGSFTIPDVAVNSTTPVPFVIEGKNVPLGTVVKLYVYSEDGTDQMISATALQGTLETSSATATALLPTGFSRGFVRATWVQ